MGALLWFLCVAAAYQWACSHAEHHFSMDLPKFIFTHARPSMAISNVFSFKVFAVSHQVLWLLSWYKLFVCESTERLHIHGFDLNLFDSLNPDSRNLHMFRKADRLPRESSVPYTPVDFLGRCHLSEVSATSPSLQWQQPTSRDWQRNYFLVSFFSAVNNKIVLFQVWLGESIKTPVASLQTRAPGTLCCPFLLPLLMRLISRISSALWSSKQQWTLVCELKIADTYTGK